MNGRLHAETPITGLLVFIFLSQCPPRDRHLTPVVGNPGAFRTATRCTRRNPSGLLIPYALHTLA